MGWRNSSLAETQIIPTRLPPCDQGSPNLMLSRRCFTGSTHPPPSVDARWLKTSRLLIQDSSCKENPVFGIWGRGAVKARSPNHPAAPFLALPENPGNFPYCRVPTSSADTPVASQMGSRAALTSPSVPLAGSETSENTSLRTAVESGLTPPT